MPGFRVLLAATALTVSLSAAGQQPAAAEPSDQPSLQCFKTKTPEDCGVSGGTIAVAKLRFSAGMKLSQEGNLQQALGAFRQAAALVPQDAEYASAREFTLQQIVLEHVQRGSLQLTEGRPIQAAASFRQALELDPSNSFARERLQQTMASSVPVESRLRVEDDTSGPVVRPSPQKKSFHFEGDSNRLLEQIAAAYGLHVTLAESVQSRQVRFDIEEVDFATAMEAANGITKTFWAPLAAEEILIASDTRDQRLQYERMTLRTFYLPQTLAAAQLNDVVNALRTIFEVRFIIPQPSNNSIAVRAPRATLEAATHFLETLDAGRPQVMLDVQVFEVSSMAARMLGLNLPLQWQAFNVGQEALELLQQPNVQELINQLFASGDINQANSTALSALLAQLQSQQNSLLQQPFATFGGGSTLTAIPFPPASVNFSANQSYVRILQRLQMRAAQGDPAIMTIGTRYPILNATFAPVFNSPALSQVIQGGSFTAPFPSFSYQDLGIKVKATPQIHKSQGEITLAMEIEIKSLGGQSFNGVPVISNRSYTGGLRLKDGESGVIAGTLDQQEQKSLSGPPGIGLIPGLGSVLSTNTRRAVESELLIVITPHMVSLPPEATQAVVLRNTP
ncbi:MAG: hypothetical protein AB7O65_06550 [Candidatus Korobacteraceae bacterium]